MEKNKAIFLDRDGTIAYDGPYCGRLENFKLFSMSAKAIKLFNDCGFKVIIITNQSGVGRGYFTEDELKKVHEKMKRDLKDGGANIDAIYYCPHHPADNCSCRKPKTALALKAISDLDIDVGRSFVVGDSESDVEMGCQLGCKTIQILSDKPISEKSSFLFTNIYEAADWISIISGKEY